MARREWSLGAVVAGVLSAAALGGESTCVPVGVVLQQATGSWSQNCAGTFSPAQLIDASKTTGWAPGRCTGTGDVTLSETVAFETSTDMVVSAGAELTFTIFSGGAEPCCGGGNLTLGRFRLSVTSDNRALFADGLSSGGDVTANWTPVSVIFASAQVSDAGGNPISGSAPVMTVQGDGSIVVSGPSPAYATYTIRAMTSLNVISGVRLEAIDGNGTNAAAADGLGTGGPGRHANGNCIVRDFKFGASQPATIVLPPNADTVVCPGDSVFLNVVAVGSLPFNYQWRKYDPQSRGGPVNIPGANASSLNLSPADLSDPGEYDVIVSNGCGSATSTRGRVTVLAADQGVQGGVAGSDGSADNNDFVVFLDHFFTMHVLGDLGGQGGQRGGDGVWDNNDFVVYIDLFFGFPACAP